MFDIWFQINKVRSVNKIRYFYSWKNKNWACTHIFLNNPSRKIIERIHYWFSCIANWSFYKAQSWWNEIYQKEHKFLTSKLHLKCLWYFCTYWKVDYTRYSYEKIILNNILELPFLSYTSIEVYWNRSIRSLPLFFIQEIPINAKG